MPPLEQWPQEARETFERLRREKFLRKQQELSGHGGPLGSDDPE
jgi:hypothetical protein